MPCTRRHCRADERLRMKYANVPALLVTSSRDRKIQVWDTASWRLLDTMILPLSGGLKSKNRGKRYNGGRSITNSQSERLWLTVVAPIGLVKLTMLVYYQARTWKLLWPWRGRGTEIWARISPIRYYCTSSVLG